MEATEEMAEMAGLAAQVAPVERVAGAVMERIAPVLWAVPATAAMVVPVEAEATVPREGTEEPAALVAPRVT